ncbi:acyl-CoA reductase-like NAD-dependent aldehyde dehydrogenase [Hydrogenivirga caldilitoris]|uniref:Acyl-CoA reductase-like NAD-dependent aldehyde dehydrogenase n=1 Tax=Hydrogenivirga caldilitoris TaxID=246264 RepID=A0A497XMK7_9AQUI|nr:aldehyde dehydrogenase family protein [Hydrogenivirga caldilitoris]RLJ70137.1 acyl-CoA reductase-like NAD-dependent aldehyde dehydrogenase [Hydrogenivirga caldilitoris]
MIEKPMLIGGEWKDSPQKIEVVYPYTGEVVGRVAQGTEEDVNRAIEAAKEGFNEVSSLTAYQRYEILMKAAELLKKRAEEFAKTLVLEVGKTIREARTEVARAIQTLIFSAEEAKRINGETFPIDAHPNGAGKVGFYIRVPVGIVSAITPFNFPLNLSMHKVAPALACGNAVILKPSERTPLTPLMLGEVLLEAGLPPKALSIIPGYGDVGKAMTTHPDVRVVSFTGSKKVGEIITRQVGIKKVVLELGSNSAIVVHKDGNIDKAVEKAVLGGYAIAGQVCISVQRVFVHEDIFEEFVEKLKERVKSLKVGDPMDESTDVGPLISEGDVLRIREWIDEALQKGARVEVGGTTPSGKTALFEPTVVSLVPPETKLFREEAFAPVVVVDPYRELEEAINMVNDSEYGLQLGVFTNDIKVAWEFIRKAEVGGVLINEGPTFRVDHQPYGGFKNSGIGREGPKFAVEDYTEIKTVILDLTS